MAINVLPPIIANQIAAGEVVTRPASVVKELLENSIDAGADAVELFVKDAGRTLIEVSDNGCGMDEQDSTRCFLPHATSKISTSEDLLKLSTMGFRGEALSSIASISQVELRSRQEGQELGTLVTIEGGQIKKTEQTNCSKGTDIRVKNIFFNTPARRNFLKSDTVECSHISEAFVKVALIYNNVSFSYYHNNKLIYKLEKADFKKRITDIFGDGFKGKLLKVEEKVDVVKINGYVSDVNLNRKTKNEEYFFVNKRYVKNNYLANAVERAYSGLLAEKSFPVFFLSLEVDPKNIDVNIHPTKTEIKFLDDKIIYAVLHSATRKALGQNILSNRLDFEKKDIVFPATKAKGPIVRPQIAYNAGYNPFAQGLGNRDFDLQKEEPAGQQSNIVFDNKGIDNETRQENQNFAPFQFLDKYIVAKMSESILLIDQHRASRNIVYQKLLDGQSIEIHTQKLIIPYTLQLSASNCMVIRQNMEKFSQIGFLLKDNGNDSFAIEALPSSLSIDKACQIITDCVENIRNKDANANEEYCFNLSEYLSIQYGAKLGYGEIMKLISDLFKLKTVDTLPNSERVLVRIDNLFLKKIF